jgi:methylamine dehydrogenase accessory protein MauD
MTDEWSLLSAFWFTSYVLLWVAVLFLGFMLLGTVRALGLLSWRLEQLEAITPKHLGRGGLKPGKKAPDFTLPSTQGPEVSLHDFAGRKVLLVFMQPGCNPCRRIAPELNRLHVGGEVQVLAVNNGDLERASKWVEETQVRFPLAVQDRLSLSKRYEVFATPFAFLILESGVIASSGIVNNKQHLGFVLSGARHEVNGQTVTETVGMEADAL